MLKKTYLIKKIYSQKLDNLKIHRIMDGIKPS